ncbi:MAG: alpha/beta fold hydrolase [Solirubrobacteraceae bacterium]
MRSTVALVLVAAALLAGAAAAQAELRFTPCTEPDQAGFECATLRVPLDRSGRVPGTLRLRVQRLISERQPAGTLINVEGGPGGSATWRAQQSARLFAPLRDRYQLVLVDPRGIGASRPYLRCSPRPARCARQLGRDATFYTTADSVADLESVRQALGAPKLFLYGTSYGTFVVSQYARTHPDHTERVVTDSPVAPAGINPLDRSTFLAVAPMLASLCAGGACDAVTRHPAADTSALARRLARRPLRTRVVSPAGRPRAATLHAYDIYAALLAGDENVALRAFYPAAVRSALDGDGAPLARLVALGRERYSKRAVNPSIWVPTNCTDMRLPWRRSDDRRARRRAMGRAIADVPQRDTWPLSRELLGSVAPGWSCVDWPPTSLARAVTTAPGPPDVPVLVLSGLLDLRTPPLDARAMAGFFAQGQLMEVPNRAHGVLRTDVACGQQALLAFVDDRPVGNPCADTPPLLGIQPVAPRRLADVPGARSRQSRVILSALDAVLDAVAIAQVAAPNGGAVRAGGLRGGSIGGRRDAATGGLQLRLDRVVHVPGVRVSGTVRATADRPRGTLRVRAGRASGWLGIDGEAWTFSGRRVTPAETTKGPRGGPFGTALATRDG